MGTFDGGSQEGHDFCWAENLHSIVYQSQICQIFRQFLEVQWFCAASKSCAGVSKRDMIDSVCHV